MSDQDWDDAPSADLASVEGLDLTVPGKPKTRAGETGNMGTAGNVPSGAGAHSPSASRVPSQDWEWGDADYSDSLDEVGERQVESGSDDWETEDTVLPVEQGIPGVPGVSPVSNLPAGEAPSVDLPGVVPIHPVSLPVDSQVPVAPLQDSPVMSVPGTGPIDIIAPLPVPQVPSPVSLLTVPGNLGGDDWEDAPVAGVALPLDANPVDLDDEVPWLGRKLAGTALPKVTLSQVSIVPEYLGEIPQAADPDDIDVDPDDNELLSAEDLKPLKPRPAKKKSHKKIRLTERDMEIMAFLARYRIANVSLLSQRFGTSVSALRNRLPALEREGLITCSWVTQTKGKVWLITSAGLSTVGMNLTAPTVRWGQLRHTLGLTEMGIKFELAGENVLTEREIRAAATRYTPTKRLRTAIDFAATVQALEEGADPVVERIRTALTVPVPGRGFGHIPDMVLAREPYPNGASGSIAIELELTRKGLSEWKTVLTAYRDSPNFDQVYYLVVSSEIKRGLEGVIKALGAQNKIHVMPIVLNDLTGDPESSGGGGE